MNKNCSICNLNFEPEPGFYYGAMFISYAFSVAVAIVSGLTLYFIFGDPAMWIYSVTVISAMLLLTPFSFRYSRSIMLHLFGGIDYDPQYSN